MECTAIKKIISASNDVQECPICHLPFKNNKAFTNDCLHCFCYQCINNWVKRQATCPLCRKRIEYVIKNVKSSIDYDIEVVPPKNDISDHSDFDETSTSSDGTAYVQNSFSEDDGSFSLSHLESDADISSSASDQESFEDSISEDDSDVDIISEQELDSNVSENEVDENVPDYECNEEVSDESNENVISECESDEHVLSSVSDPNSEEDISEQESDEDISPNVSDDESDEDISSSITDNYSSENVTSSVSDQESDEDVLSSSLSD